MFSGKVDDARKTWELGVRADPKFPFFHYNLACWHAEKGERAKALAELALAKKNRDHGYEGGHLPDARTDSSFERYREDEEFRKILRDW